MIEATHPMVITSQQETLFRVILTAVCPELDSVAPNLARAPG